MSVFAAARLTSARACRPAARPRPHVQRALAALPRRRAVEGGPPGARRLASARDGGERGGGGDDGRRRPALKVKVADLRGRGAERAAALKARAADVRADLRERGADLKADLREKTDALKEKKAAHAAWVAADGADLGLSEKLKRVIYAYGPLALSFHLGCEALAFGGFYVAVSNGALDVDALLAAVEARTGVDAAAKLPPGASSAVVAYLLTGTLTGVPRTLLTLTATPVLARKLGWRPKKLPE